MDTRQFTQIYPAVSGAGALLIDCPDESSAPVTNMLREAFVDSGIELEFTHERLAKFNRVESTYLEIFQALGGLGLLIGTVGLALVVSRNVLERRSELAVMRAVGYSRNRLTVLLFMEHAIVFADGIVVGVIAGLVAIVPAIRSQAGEVPWSALVTQIGIMLVVGFMWIWGGCALALRGNLVSALRNE